MHSEASKPNSGRWLSSISQIDHFYVVGEHGMGVSRALVPYVFCLGRLPCNLILPANSIGFSKNQVPKAKVKIALG